MDLNERRYTLSALIDKIIEGDERAFRQLFDLYYRHLFHHALYYLSSKEQAEETVLDVFCVIWKRKGTLGDITNIEHYLFTSVKNQALHYIRRPNGPDAESLDLYQLELIPDADNPESSLLDRERLNLIQKAIDSLPDKCKEVFRLVWSDRLRYKEIAKLLDISEKTVEAHVATAYKKIRIYVGKMK